MRRDPHISVTGPDGVNLAERLCDVFVGIRVSDFAGGEVDELHIIFRRQKPYLMPPPPGTVFTARLGWEAERAQMMGEFAYERTLYSGEPESGQEMILVCRAADLTDAWKRVDSEHFDDETGHKTYGDVLRTLASKAGVDVAIDATLDALPLPSGYLLRWKQSAIGLATEIADDLGAIVKLQAGKLTVRRRGSFTSPSGGELPAIAIPFDPNYAFQADIEPRYGFSEVAAGWFDDRAGRAADLVHALSGGFARLALPHLAGSEAFAKASAEAAAQKLEAESATAYFEMAGNAAAVAGAPVKPEGFGPDIDGVNWEAIAVYHDAGPDRGWITTVEAALAW
ncbi:hypothetical protein [Afifella marina]|uniref:Phage protein D n=1 Tax=Afifella marina DSM 2698 TaxID=1120955 RepID=A0A1G5MGX0_AFIMA|nr:hypothetical protein [Afifella marina]MBK1625203.1 hypothetical protein [Afifella marina DSM 2698]MBK1628920.1 hypothetical protein [Afifella marina]MBK5918299.1 hypothetical protein [Afifella marina]RAI22818.1 hypothetical protein CH311_03975 [Afifella marina DSM 2698]SCZ23891.1 hypothetical protein SAMN03080610_00621 [Afifella marina DSM 2698]